MPYFFALLALLWLPGTASSASEQDDRATYRQALEFVRKGQFSRSKELQQQLGDYPLAPYVEYHRLNKSIRQTSASQIDSFRERHGDLPATKLLYSRWLKDQGKRRNWRTLVERRYDTSNAELECYFVRAQYGIGEKTQALDATTALWSKPKSQPKACDPLFSVWRGTERFSQGVIWQRFSGAMDANERVLARYLQRYLTGARRNTAKAFTNCAVSHSESLGVGHLLRTPPKTVKPSATAFDVYPRESLKAPQPRGQRSAKPTRFSIPSVNSSRPMSS